MEENKNIDWENEYKYLLAEFDNYKKRQVKKLGDKEKYKLNDIGIELLDVVDDIEFGLDIANDKGLQMIHKRLTEVLNKNRINKIYADGKRPAVFTEFSDNATQVIPTQDKTLDNVIVDVFKPGYMYKDKVLRYEDVIVYKYSE